MHFNQWPCQAKKTFSIRSCWIYKNWHRIKLNLWIFKISLRLMTPCAKLFEYYTDNKEMPDF